VEARKHAGLDLILLVANAPQGGKIASRKRAIGIRQWKSGLADFADFSVPAAIHAALSRIFWVDFDGCSEVAQKVLPMWRIANGNLYYRGRRRVVAAACLTGSCFQLESAALLAHIAQSLLFDRPGASPDVSPASSGLLIET
jgi:hypothetical protein